MSIQGIGNSCHNSFAPCPLRQPHVDQENLIILPLDPNPNLAKLSFFGTLIFGVNAP